MREKESGRREDAPANMGRRGWRTWDARMRRGGTGRRAGQYATGWSIQYSSEKGKGQKSKIGIMVHEKVEPMLII